jgi:hypothetical protein
MTKTNAELAREYVYDAMRGNVPGSLTAVHGREAVLTAANVLAVLATADAMRQNVAAAERLLAGDTLAEVAEQPESQYKVGDPDPGGCGSCASVSPVSGDCCFGRAGHASNHWYVNGGVGSHITEVWS